MTRLLGYASHRDVVFLMGAGASAGDGVPLQRDLLPYIAAAQDEALERSWYGSGLRDFLLGWFDSELEDGLYPSLEEVFGLIDLHISGGEMLGEIHPEVLPQVRGALIACIHHAVHAATQGSPSVYRAFWERVDRVNRNVSVVSLNYDPMLENAFDFLFPDRALIDFRLPLVNYDTLDGLSGFWWWIDPAAPVKVHRAVPVPIKILKLHGSLTWKYCSYCRSVLFTPWDSEIDLDEGGFKWTTGPPEDRWSELRCPYDGTPYESLIVPPAHGKTLTHPVLSQLINEAIREFRVAKRVVVVGYSFPEADVHLRSLLARGLGSSHLLVVDPSLSERAQARFRSISSAADFFEGTLEEFVASGELDRVLVSTGGGR